MEIYWDRYYNVRIIGIIKVEDMNIAHSLHEFVCGCLVLQYFVILGDFLEISHILH